MLKQIKTKQDFAIFGAAPAFLSPLHVGSPNVGDKSKFLKQIEGIFERRWFSNRGQLVQELERKIAKHLNTKHCVTFCNGTIALEIAIRALELTGEVIIPSFTFVATAHALNWQQITPVFADIDPKTHRVDVDSIRKMITPKTTGIIGVHLWGQPCSINAIRSLAEEFGLKVIFDAAHAFSCSYEGQMIGGFGECEVFSFHATKFFNTFEGGAIATNNDDLADRVRLMQNFGFSGYDRVIYPGTNGKMTEVSAAMGLVGLESLDDFVRANHVNYRAYDEFVSQIPGVSLLRYANAEKRNYQYIVIELTDEFPLTRNELLELLHAENILARRYFWPGCHKMEPYRSLFPHASLLLPNTEIVAERVLVLPTGTSISSEHIETITSIIRLASQPSFAAPIKTMLAA